MNQEEFANLYVNANSLAELALRRAKLEAEQLLQSVDHVDLPIPTEAESDAMLEASFEGIDMSAWDDLNLGEPAEDQDQTENPKEPGDEGETIQQSPATPGPIDEGNLEDGEHFDIDKYMANAYSLQQQLAARIAAAQSRVDVAELNSLLQRLPANLPALTSRLQGRDLDQWLTLYLSQESPVEDVVLLIRRLDTL